MRHDLTTEFELAVLELSVSSRLALAMCHVNALTHTLYGNLRKLAVYSDHLWGCPLLGANAESFPEWFEREPAIARAVRLADFEGFWSEFRGPADPAASVFDVLQPTSNILDSCFWGAAENEATFELFKRVRSKSGIAAFPSLTPFKFSKFDDGHGWGTRMEKKDQDFWRWYAETWFTQGGRNSILNAILGR